MARDVSKLKLGQTVAVSCMVVQVTTILDDWKDGVFGLVADSSGIIFAYLKKFPLKKIKVNDVIWILGAKVTYNKDIR